MRCVCSCFQPRMSRRVLNSVSPRLLLRSLGGTEGPQLLAGVRAPRSHRKRSAMCNSSGLHPSCSLSICGESPVDILGSFLQSAAEADVRCSCSNWVKKIRGAGCVKEKPEWSLHLTSFLFSDLDNGLGSSVNRRELF